MNDTPDKLLNLVEKLLLEMVSIPSHLEVSKTCFTQSMTVKVRADAEDTAKLIGEGSSNYKALSTIVGALGHRAGWSVLLARIMEPIVGVRKRVQFKPDPDWPAERIEKLLEELIRALVRFPETVELAAHHDEECYTTTIEVFVARTEDPDLVAGLNAAIWKVFDAIGRNRGRILNVKLVPMNASAQPKTAQGRFSKEMS